MGFIDTIKNYEPTIPAMVWTAVGASALTMAAGFFGLGWVTGGTAEDMANEARNQGHAELAAAICEENFRSYPAALEQHQQISEMSGFRQRQFVEGQPWALMPGAESVGRDVAQLCAARIVGMSAEDLPAQVTEEAIEQPEVDAG